MDAKTYWKKWADKCRKDLTTDIMPFWLKYGWDRKNGGVYTCVDRDGKLMDSTKSGWFQGRFAFTCSYAYNAVKKDKKYLAAGAPTSRSRPTARRSGCAAMSSANASPRSP